MKNTFVWIFLLVSVTAASSDDNKKQTNKEQCISGETKHKDCNLCKCINGEFACSKNKCPTDREKRDAFSCTPGQTFKKDCNTCTCTPDGKNAVCTSVKCVSPPANTTQ